MSRMQETVNRVGTTLRLFHAEVEAPRFAFQESTGDPTTVDAMFKYFPRLVEYFPKKLTASKSVSIACLV